MVPSTLAKRDWASPPCCLLRWLIGRFAKLLVFSRVFFTSLPAGTHYGCPMIGATESKSAASRRLKVGELPSNRGLLSSRDLPPVPSCWHVYHGLGRDREGVSRRTFPSLDEDTWPPGRFRPVSLFSILRVGEAGGGDLLQYTTKWVGRAAAGSYTTSSS